MNRISKLVIDSVVKLKEERGAMEMAPRVCVARLEVVLQSEFQDACCVTAGLGIKEADR